MCRRAKEDTPAERDGKKVDGEKDKYGNQTWTQLKPPSITPLKQEGARQIWKQRKTGPRPNRSDTEVLAIQLQQHNATTFTQLPPSGV